jgi:hypothetical protein
MAGAHHRWFRPCAPIARASLRAAVGSLWPELGGGASCRISPFNRRAVVLMCSLTTSHINHRTNHRSHRRSPQRQIVMVRRVNKVVVRGTDCDTLRRLDADETHFIKSKETDHCRHIYCILETIGSSHKRSVHRRPSSSPSAQAAFRRCVLPINLRQPQPSAVLLLALHWRPLGWRSLAPPPVPRPGPRRAARPAPPRRGRPRLRRPRLASRWLASRVPARPQSMPLSSGGTTGGSKGGRRPGRRPSLAESSSTGRGWGTPDAAVMAAARCLALAPPRSGPGALQIAGRAA